MTATSPVNGIQYPDLTNVKDQVAQFATMNTNVDTSIVPRFTNTSDRDARITSPIEGQVAYLTQESLLTVYNGNAWRTADTSRTIQKALTEQITAATTALNVDDALYFYGEANSVYKYELMLFYTGSNTVDAIKAGIFGPTGSTKVALLSAPTSGSTNTNSTQLRMGNTSIGQTPAQGTHTTAGSYVAWWEKGTLRTSSTPGLFQVQWGKPTAYATALQVSATSFLTYTKIS